MKPRRALALALILLAGCGGNALQQATRRAYAAKQACEQLYVSIRVAWHQGRATDEEMAAARALIERYFAAQSAWQAELARAQAEGDTALVAPGRRTRIEQAASTVTDCLAGLTRLWLRIRDRRPGEIRHEED